MGGLRRKDEKFIGRDKGREWKMWNF